MIALHMRFAKQTLFPQPLTLFCLGIMENMGQCAYCVHSLTGRSREEDVWSVQPPQGEWLAWPGGRPSSDQPPFAGIAGILTGFPVGEG